VSAFFPSAHTILKEILMARVTGIGGVFLKARDPKALAAWYAQHLGIQLADYGGASFLWSDEVPAGTGQTMDALPRRQQTLRRTRLSAP
jgi:hypothetical protein